MLISKLSHRRTTGMIAPSLPWLRPAVFLFLAFLLLQPGVARLASLGFFREPFLEKILLCADRKYKLLITVGTNEYLIFEWFARHNVPPVCFTLKDPLRHTPTECETQKHRLKCADVVSDRTIEITQLLATQPESANLRFIDIKSHICKCFVYHLPSQGF